ncbi:hypothetical protein CCR94_20695 [Rhodoblastus sphagnicola]|uniref:Uncharacterized protein n=1 Tax=Rhodoblastus sphagnicola TaxID=333368 RepID=A0A2S6MY13_9HYPH|nr:hypothetical protein [Rhodoblastus sphagnicola]MBB4198111.1 hypothetical protein [Rhodoblastus sphagnicola]PPQ27250.1 hypothetical protein CCR94_20695 [Rhodoblastus sphagnicola]
MVQAKVDAMKLGSGSVRRYLKQVQLGIFALAALVAAAAGVVMLSPKPQAQSQPAPQAQPEQAPAQPASPPLAVKPVTTQPIAPEAQTFVPPDPELESAWADKLREAPDYRAFFNRMRADFPAEWTQSLRDASAEGGLRKPEGVDLLMSLAVQAARAKSGLLAARAGGPALDRLFAGQRAVARQLATSDSALCLDFLNGAAAQRFTLFAATHRALMAGQALAGLDAIGDGAKARIQRETPTQADFDQLEKALREKGLPSEAIALLLDGKQPATPIPDDKACNNGVVYLETLARLDEPARMRLYALAVTLMAHD